MSVVDAVRAEILAELPGDVPARAVLERAEALREEGGHENLGFLSARRGFAPLLEPAATLPAEFAAWDQAAAALPELYRSLRLRRELDALPMLDAGPQSLPDGDLLRAALVLGFLAQSYWYVETRPVDRLPAALDRPWAQVRERLLRPERTVSVVDLLYNWETANGRRSAELNVENLRLMVPTVGTQEERVFYLTPLEILADSAPMVTAMIRAQEAVAADDPAALEMELAILLERVEQMHSSINRIDPHPGARTYVDPVVWAKTVAPLVVPLKDGDQGPSGTASPIFLALDVFLGRRRFDTYLGREVHRVRTLYPPLWQGFLDALEAVSVTGYATRVGGPVLDQLRQLVDCYVGPEGFLARHRMKVRGYLELAFKVGRSITITGFQGAFTDRTWDAVDNELELARRERAPKLPDSCQVATVKRVRRIAPDGPDEIVEVVLDVSGLVMRYRPGDHCCVLPRNSDELVGRTLRALGLRGDEPVELTGDWLDSARLRGEPTACTARELLRHGQLRPVAEDTAAALLALHDDPWLTGLVRDGGASRFELWDLLQVLRRRGLGAVPADRLCSIVAPLRPRQYSISSASPAPDGELRLTVARVRYSSAGEDREGTASAFLATAEPGTQVLVRTERAPRFTLPADPATPIVMIAGGSGVAPFRGFVAERCRHADAGPAWLLLGLRTSTDVLECDELATARSSGMLRVDVALSRPAAGAPRRIGELLGYPATARTLTGLVEGGAHVYVCGGQGFTKTALAALERTLGAERLERLTAQGRLGVEAFAGHDPDAELPELGWSRIAEHNDERNGRWLVLDGRVFDVEPFVRRHPGGVRILSSWAGTDATEAFSRSHSGRADIRALRELLVIGRVRPTERAAHRAWVSVLQLVVEMQNALANDQDLIRTTTTRDDRAPHLSPYNLQRSIETHERFLRTYLDVLLDESFPNIWAATAADLDVPHEPGWLAEKIAQLRAGDDARWLEECVPALHRALDHAVAGSRSAGSRSAGGVLRACSALARQDGHVLAEIKAVLCAAVESFEHGAPSGQALAGSAAALVDAVAAYHRRLHADRALLELFDACLTAG